MGMEKLFNPESIAIVGASHKPEKIGYLVAKNMKEQGFSGKVFYINNHYKGKILGHPVYSSFTEIREDIDLVLFAIPAEFIAGYFASMKKKNINYAVVLSAGFRESGKKGMVDEQNLLVEAQKNNIIFLGPNCLGFVNTTKKINLTFLKNSSPVGNIGFVSQSGALGSMMVDHYRAHHNLGFSYFVSLGNKSMVDESGVLEFLAGDEKTQVIGLYLEDVRNGEKFKKTLKNITRKKPVVVLKAGKTKEAAKAAISHTGSMVGDDEVFDGLCRQYGVIRADNMTEFLTILKILSFDQLPKSKNILCLSNAGGLAVLLTDELVKNDLILETISETMEKKLKKTSLAPKMNIHNPIDLLGDASAFDYQQVIEVTTREKDVGAVIILLTPQANTEIKKTTSVIIAAQKKINKPIYSLFMGEESIEGSHLAFEKAHIASFYKYDYLPSSLKKILFWQEYKQEKPQDESFILEKLDYEAKKKEGKIMKKYDLSASLDLMKELGIPVVENFLVKSQEELKKIKTKINYPCVAKVVSEKITHKTDVGGVLINIDSYEELAKDVKKMLLLAPAASVMIQPMVTGYELIVGAKRDFVFGVVLSAGLGGIYAELLKNISYRIFPFNYAEFKKMISETAAGKLITGFRGQKAVNDKLIYEIMIKIGYLMTDNLEIKELEINPLIISSKQIFAVDARVIIG